jgi:hypothetical protein
VDQDALQNTALQALFDLVLTFGVEAFGTMAPVALEDQDEEEDEEQDTAETGEDSTAGPKTIVPVLQR